MKMGDLSQARYNEQQKLAAKLIKEAEEKAARDAEIARQLSAITGATTDDEIRERAKKIGHRLAVPAFIVEQILFLERRVTQLEADRD
jgi:hypothetical protein